MNFEPDQILMHSMVQLLEQASARTGFTPAEIEALIDSELETDHLLAYISAVLSNRMN